MKIGFVYPKNRLNRVEQLERGEIPSDFFFGSYELEKRGHTVKLFDCTTIKKGGIKGRILNMLYDYRLLPSSMKPNLLLQSAELIEEADDLDVIVAYSSGAAMSLALRKMIIRKPLSIVPVYCGILDRQTNRIQFALTKRIVRSTASLAFGDGEGEEMINRYSIPDGHMRKAKFGVDTIFWTPGDDSEAQDYILAVGSDPNRDYESLIDAALDIDINVRILTIRSIEKPIPANVEVTEGYLHKKALTDKELRTLYRNALLVVTPLKQAFKSSGQSATIQAMACGKAVVLSKTNGVWDKTHLQHGKNIHFVRPQNCDELRQAIILLMNDADKRRELGVNARDYAVQYGNIENFASDIEDTCRMAIGGGS